MTVHKLKQQNGFALLMALVVVSVVVSVGLSVLELTIKQVRLSTNSRDSETAFHAANAGIECARYWREANSDDLEAGTAAPINCFGAGNITPTVTPVSVSGGGTAYLYATPAGSNNQITWGGTGAPRCTQLRVMVISSTPTQSSVTPNLNAVTYFEGYPYNNGIKTCTAGGRCTIISSRGYSKACSSIGTTGTVQREVLLEL